MAEVKKPAAKVEKEVKAEVKEEKVAPVKEVKLNRLAKKYKEEIVPALIKEFNYTTPMQAPKLEKIVVNMGVGDATQNSKLLDDAVADLTTVTTIFSSFGACIGVV